MRKGERLAIFIVVILISIALLLSAKLVKIGFDSFATAREAKKTEEAEKANRWGDEPKYDTKDPVDPDADPQGTNPDNADYGDGSNVHNSTEESIEPDFEEPEYRKNSESDEGYLVDSEPVPTPEPPKKVYPESSHKETNPPKKEYGSKSKADESHEERVEKDPPLVESDTSQRSSVHEYTDEMLVVPE